MYFMYIMYESSEQKQVILQIVQVIDGRQFLTLYLNLK